MTELTCVATYRRRIGASLDRVWENVRDWQHLPWLHRESFASIALEQEGKFGWRARVGLHAPSEPLRLELVVDGELRYVARTLEGPGAATEIWTRLDPVDAHQTDIEVAFWLPGVAPERSDALGAGYVALYTRLWDQDEAMMQRRSFLLDARRGAPTPAEDVDLGAEQDLERRLPLRVMFAGRPVVVARCEGELVAFDALCPHALGPLDVGDLTAGRVTCPWHGYAFDVRSRRGCGDAQHLRLAPAPRLERAGAHVWLRAR